MAAIKDFYLIFSATASRTKLLKGMELILTMRQSMLQGKNFPYNFKVCDGMSIDFPDKYFDLVIVIATIKHVRYEDRSSVYAELNRVAEYALLIEADEKDRNTQSMMGWTFYNSHFEKEFEENFEESITVVQEAGDILGLYKCKG